MKKLSKLTALLLAAVMALSLAACAGPGAENSQPVETKGSQGEPAGGKYTVGICQQDQHPALDAATQGFKDALVEKLGQDGVAFKEGNASGDTANCPTIINGFLSENVDLILANATGSLQAAHSATADIPILGTSVTDYATALELENWSGTVGGNISGTSDLAPLDQQAEMLHELFPDARNVGLLYCSGEPNSVYQCDVIEGYLKEMGYSVSRFAFTDTNDVASVAQTACDGSDVIYIPTDNTAAKNTEAIANVVLPAKVPVIAGEEGLCKGCGVATLTISYYDIGHIAGEMAYEILANGADISTMPVKSAPQVVKKYNAANCEALGIAAPEGYEAIAAE